MVILQAYISKEGCKQLRRPRSLLFLTCLLLAGCYYAPDLKNQTVGSFAGGMFPGLALAEAAVASTTVGVIGGSMVGSTFGQHFDNHSPLARDNPVYSPVHRYYYQVARPDLEIDCFKTGKIFYRNSDQLPELSATTQPVNKLDK